jgi:hypothetical protein
VVFTAFVPQNNTSGTENFDQFITLSTEDVYNDDQYRNQIVGNIKYRMDLFYQNTIPSNIVLSTVSAVLAKDELGNPYVKFDKLNLRD